MTIPACAHCQAPLSEQKIRRHARFCGKACLRERDKLAWRAANPGMEKPLATSTTGAISEFIVGADLLLRGYEVFRAISAACSCDFLALKNGKATRIEVRTAALSPGGKLMFAFREADGPRHDVLAVVLVRDKTITYQPPLD